MNSLDNLVVSCFFHLRVGVASTSHPGKIQNKFRPAAQSDHPSGRAAACNFNFRGFTAPEPKAEGAKGLILTFQSGPRRCGGGQLKSADSLPACRLLFPLTDVTANRPASIIISVSQCTGTRWAPCVCHLVSVHCARLQM